MRGCANSLAVSALILALAVSGQTSDLSGPAARYPPSPSSAAAGILEMIPCRGGDSPLSPHYSWSGTGGVAVDVVGNTEQRGTFSIEGIPAGAQIVWAYMYEACWWEPSPDVPASVTFAGTALPSVLPFNYDSTGTGGYVLCVYRWDVTSLVAGDGDYDYAVSFLRGTFGQALAVVYSDVAEPVREIRVNHGAEALERASSSTSFSSVEADSATLFIFTQADDSTGHGEAVRFNDSVVAGPGNIFIMNSGFAASLLELSVECVTGINTVACTTGSDYFGWHLAILETYGLAVKVTGGGWFVGGRVGSNSKKTFGFNVHSESGGYRGQLQFNDHALGIKMHSDCMDGLAISGDTAASFSGDCTVNKVCGYSFECVVEDRGEPGRRTDTFELRILDAEGDLFYSTGGVLKGGNIQIHVRKDSEGEAAGSAAEGRPGSSFGFTPSIQHDVRDGRGFHTSLHNTPNPLRGATEIYYSLPASGRITLDIYDATGRHVESLIDAIQDAGAHSVRWNASRNDCGVYFYRLTFGKYEETGKMMVVD